MHSQAKQQIKTDPPAELTVEAFPAARYFQIHFEYLQEQMQSLLRQQEGLQQQIQQLDKRLSTRAQNGRVANRVERKAKDPVVDSDTAGLMQLGNR